MPKLPKRLPYEVAIAAALILGSCSDNASQSGYSEFSVKQYDQISDIAREATAQDRDRLDAIEAKLGMDNSGD